MNVQRTYIYRGKIEVKVLLRSVKDMVDVDGFFFCVHFINLYTLYP